MNAHITKIRSKYIQNYVIWGFVVRVINALITVLSFTFCSPCELLHTVT